MNEIRLNRICPICGETYGKVLRSVKMILQKEASIPGEYNVVGCKKCGFTFADVKASQESYNQYYANSNNYATSKELTENSKKMVYGNNIEYLKQHVGKDEKVLDVGCGAGELLKLLKKEGFTNLWGLDPSQNAMEILKNNGINGIHKNMFDDWSVEEKFDVIISTAVMEHIYDLNGFIKIAKKHLKLNGKFYAAVPAVEGFDKYYQSAPNYFNQEHINYFSTTSMSSLMRCHGFEPMSLESAKYYLVPTIAGSGDLMMQNIFLYTGEDYLTELHDEISEQSILNYGKTEANDKRLLNLVEELKKIKGKCIIWGAGALAMSLLTNDVVADKVDFFVDNNIAKHGKEVFGKVIYPPEVLYESKNTEKTIVIACMLYPQEILDQISKMNFQNSVIIY